VVQVLTDLDLKITKSDIFSDGGWFMDGKFSSIETTQWSEDVLNFLLVVFSHPRNPFKYWEKSI
jgi:hypothetical protein